MGEEGSNNFSLVSLGKPIEKLIDTVSKAVGTLYRPRAIRNEADAEAYKIEVIANAKAKASIVKSDTDSDIVERARQRLYHQEIQRQINIDNVVEMTTQYLDKTVSEEPVDEDWRTLFFNKAQDVTSEDLQVVWAKVLANEINKPGNFSLRTLNILSNLSSKEALKFTEFCGLTTESGDVIKVNGPDLTKYGVTLEDLLLLREAGLVDHTDNLEVQYNFLPITTDRKRMAISLKWLGGGLIVDKKDKESLDFNIYSLTNSGKELSKIVKPIESGIYRKDIKNMLIKSGYSVQETRVVYRLKKEYQ
jgi:hypothetical protein